MAAQRQSPYQFSRFTRSIYKITAHTLIIGKHSRDPVPQRIMAGVCQGSQIHDPPGSLLLGICQRIRQYKTPLCVRVVDFHCGAVQHGDHISHPAGLRADGVLRQRQNCHKVFFRILPYKNLKGLQYIGRTAHIKLHSLHGFHRL